MALNYYSHGLECGYDIFKEALDQFAEDNLCLCLGTDKGQVHPRVVAERIRAKKYLSDTFVFFFFGGINRISLALSCDVIPDACGIRANIYHSHEIPGYYVADELNERLECFVKDVRLYYQFDPKYIFTEVPSHFVDIQSGTLMRLGFGRIPFSFLGVTLEGGRILSPGTLWIHPLDDGMEVDKDSLAAYFKYRYGEGSDGDEGQHLDWMLQQTRMLYPLSETITLKAIKPCLPEQ